MVIRIESLCIVIYLFDIFFNLMGVCVVFIFIFIISMLVFLFGDFMEGILFMSDLNIDCG